MLLYIRCVNKKMHANKFTITKGDNWSDAIFTACFCCPLSRQLAIAGLNGYVQVSVKHKDLKTIGQVKFLCDFMK